MAKKKPAPITGRTCGGLVKNANEKRQEFVIGGWAESKMAVLLNHFYSVPTRTENSEWMGRSGGGFSQEMPGIQTSSKLETGRSPCE